MMRALAANGLNLLVVALIVLAGMIGWGVAEFRRSGPLGEAQVVMLPRGSGLNAITDELAAKGVIRNAAIFRIGARYTGRDTSLRFGEYAIPAGASMDDILEILASGRSILYRVTIPEGWTSWQIVERLKTVEVLTGEIAAVPAEGSLAPDTYSFQRGTSRAEVLQDMAAAQRRILAEAWEGRAADLPLQSPEEVLILASIVEKETGVAEERPVVASVFVNRMREGMRLETDPTVIYGITLGQGELGRELTRGDLRSRTPYNTYQIDRLPPTPIANPGRAAIAATVQPAQTEFRYFVADGTGGHVFASTLREHNANVTRWRAIRAQQERDAAPAQP